ncbi:MAG: hypothetical protein IK066_04125 [Kiritimatiellae bacterium]|nr:hypothetical protein [Kiritimatiellia bacterium]
MQVPETFQSLLKRHHAWLACRTPRPVVAAYESDFAKNADAFAAFGKANRGTAILLQLGYEHETPALAEQLAGTVAKFLGDVPDARVVVLCNSPGECASLGAHGVETRLVNQNCFLDERRYRPLASKERPYDAAYLARLTPCKRHELVPEELAPKLLLLGCSVVVYSRERPYAEMVYRRYAAARTVGSFRGASLSEWLAKAKCGLALSDREGACFASSEYFLCGLPVVDTPSLGGRDVLYPGEFVRRVEATPEAVGEGVAHWAAHPQDPRDVRAAWLEKAEAHREAYRELMRELTGRTPPRPAHKLGLRTPHPDRLHTLAIEAYLWAKGWMVR